MATSTAPMVAATSNDVVVADGLGRTFGSTTALTGLTLDVARGEVLGILGHNGAGKTTFLRLVTGVLRPSAGTIRTFGATPATDGPAVRRRTGVVTESSALEATLTVAENLVAHAHLFHVPTDRIRRNVPALLAAFDLDDVADRTPHQLSSGLRQRAAFARALVHDPDLLLLDEPTANMDPVAAHQVRAVLTRLVRERNCTVVLSTHNLVEAQEACDRVAILRQGRLEALGPVEQLAGDLVGGLATRVRTDRESVEVATRVLARFGPTTADGDPTTLLVHHDTAPQVATMVARLVEAGVPVLEATPVSATLEHVYLALHRRQDTT